MLQLSSKTPKAIPFTVGSNSQSSAWHWSDCKCGPLLSHCPPELPPLLSMSPLPFLTSLTLWQGVLSHQYKDKVERVRAEWSPTSKKPIYFIHEACHSYCTSRQCLMTSGNVQLLKSLILPFGLHCLTLLITWATCTRLLSPDRLQPMAFST